MAKAKATKKFEKRHLKDSLKRRKDVKSKQKLFATKKHRTINDDAQMSNDKDHGDALDGTGVRFEDMTVDDFFQGGFEVPEVRHKKRKQGGLSTRVTASKKAKVEAHREDEEKEDIDESESGSEEDHHAGGGTVDRAEDDSEFESDDDEETHKKDLGQLAKKDPEFFKYLQENDSELLDFEEGDFAEIDQLSDDERPQKRRTETETEEASETISAPGSLNLAIVKKWEDSMVERKSLRTVREIILAFRAAAHINDATKKEYKYTITNSDGEADGPKFSTFSNILSLQ